jgi:hypothetical protein
MTPTPNGIPQEDEGIDYTDIEERLLFYASDNLFWVLRSK